MTPGSSHWLTVKAGYVVVSGTRLSIEKLQRLFNRQVIRQKGCWGWRTKPNTDGYSRLWLPRNGGRATFLYAHQAAWILKGKRAPTRQSGKTLDHKCRNRPCPNPNHLQVLTRGANVLAGSGPVAQNARKTHCKHGHPFTGENTYLHDGKRHCVSCRRRIVTRWNQQRSEARRARALNR